MKDSRNVMLVGFVALLALVALGGYFVVMPFISMESARQEALADREGLRTAAQTELNYAQDLASSIDKVTEIDTSLQESFPSAVDTLGFSRLVESAAAQSGIDPLYVRTITAEAPVVSAPPVAPEEEPIIENPAAEPVPSGEIAGPEEVVIEDPNAPVAASTGSAYSTFAIEIATEGEATLTQESVNRFVETLQKATRAVLVEDITIVTLSERDPGIISVSLSGKLYLYQNLVAPSEEEIPAPEEVVVEE